MDIGIIGGADGPTAIFVAAPGFGYIIALAVIILGGVIAFGIRRKK